MEKEFIREILSKVDHTLLSPRTVWEEIRALCDDGIKFRTASVCIPPSFVRRAAEYLNGRLPVCTVIGFPNGYATKEVKCFETEDALARGAAEIDMVINLGMMKDKKYEMILDEIKSVKRVCGEKILKVIVETCLLTQEEKITACHIVSESGADFIKTSTGFSTGGATREDIKLFSENISSDIKIKAAGGISSLEDARDFIELGASRLGTSRIVKIIKEMGYGYTEI